MYTWVEVVDHLVALLGDIVDSNNCSDSAIAMHNFTLTTRQSRTSIYHDLINVMTVTCEGLCFLSLLFGLCIPPCMERMSKVPSLVPTITPRDITMHCVTC